MVQLFLNLVADFLHAGKLGFYLLKFLGSLFQGFFYLVNFVVHLLQIFKLVNLGQVDGI